MKKTFVTLTTAATLIVAACGNAQSADGVPDSMAALEGTYAGTFLCGLGEMGMTLSLKDAGERAMDDGKEGYRTVSGVINFFPTVSNPDSPAGAFNVSGWVNAGTERFNKLGLEPGDWIDQPENFGTSGMEGMIINGKINGRPTADGCHTLSMRKIAG